MSTTPVAAPAADDLARHVATLRHRVDGEVLRPADRGFVEAARTWNTSAVHEPAVIVLAQDVGDVIATVAFAADTGLGLGVQATGHGLTLPVDGVLLVTSAMVDIEIDAEARTAWVGAGCRWAPVLAAAQEHRLAPLVASSTSVGAVGYTLGGGLGWLARRYGPACDAVRSFEVVTPDGELVCASRDEHVELFHALRGGGGGSLGVVTEMEVELFPVTTVYGGNLWYAADDAAEVVARWSAWVDGAPDALTSSVVLVGVPPDPGAGTGRPGRSLTAVRGCWCGDLEEGRRLLDAWRALMPPTVDAWREMSFADVDAISAEPVDPRPTVTTGGWLTEDDRRPGSGLPDAVGEILAAATFGGHGPPILRQTEIRHAGGAIAAGGGRHRSSMGNRGARFLVHMVGVPRDEHEAAGVAAHHRATKTALGDCLSGRTYLNLLDGPERARAATTSIDGPDLEAIVELRRAVDPDAVLRFGVDHGR